LVGFGESLVGVAARGRAGLREGLPAVVRRVGDGAPGRRIGEKAWTSSAGVGSTYLVVNLFREALVVRVTTEFSRGADVERVVDDLRLTGEGPRDDWLGLLSTAVVVRVRDAQRGTRGALSPPAAAEVFRRFGGPAYLAFAAGSQPAWDARCCRQRPQVVGAPHMGSKRVHTGWFESRCEGGVMPLTVTLRSLSFMHLVPPGDGVR
jgi:hypothetical protein